MIGLINQLCYRLGGPHCIMFLFCATLTCFYVFPTWMKGKPVGFSPTTYLHVTRKNSGFRPFCFQQNQTIVYLQYSIHTGIYIYMLSYIHIYIYKYMAASQNLPPIHTLNPQANPYRRSIPEFWRTPHIFIIYIYDIYIYIYISYISYIYIYHTYIYISYIYIYIYIIIYIYIYIYDHFNIYLNGGTRRITTVC